MARIDRIFVLTTLILIQNNLRNVLADCASDLENYFHIPKPITVTENTPGGTVMANITQNGELEFSDSTSSSLLIIESGTLVLNETLSLDGPENEAACAKISNENLKIRCKNGGRGVDVYIQYSLTDDFDSVILSNVSAHVLEEQPPGTFVFRPQNITTDADCKSVFFFNVDPVSDYFRIDSNKDLVLKKEVDFEQQTEYHLTLVVRSNVENSKGYRSSSTELTVYVVDIDDRDPVFDINHFVLHVPEEQNVTSAWLSSDPPIFARDGDVGINTTIVYSLASITPQLALDIHNETGKVMVLDTLDRESIPAYTVIVKAAQADLSYKTATAILSLVVDDINDNRPVYTAENSTTIQEDAATGSTVLELTGKDLDEGQNAEFDFVIVSDSLGAFGVYTNNATKNVFLIVASNAALRGRELAQVQIFLREKTQLEGGPPCDNVTTCVGHVTVYITDVNDNSPVFRNPSYQFVALSNQSAGSVVGQVEATDADRGDNAKIVYNMVAVTVSVECSKLTLDPVTGTLTLKQQLAAGVMCSWVVTACDSPTDQNLRRCSSVPLSVTVVLSGDVVVLDAAVPENVPQGTPIIAIPTKGLHVSGLDFVIRDDILYTNTSLDRERQDKYQVQIFSGNNDSSAVMVINVRVEDVNDNPPIFDLSVYFINLDSHVTINQILLQVNASDADIGDNGRFEFSLVTGGEYFSIDPLTGKIRLLNFPTTNYSEFQLKVTDFGFPSLQSLATLKVYTPLLNETATILLPVAKDELMKDRDGIAKKLSNILEVIVTIYSIESIGLVDDMGSRLYIGASKNGEAVEPTELNSLLQEKASQVYSAFLKQSQGTANPSNSDDLSVLEIVLICVAGALLLLTIVVTALWIRSYRKYKRSVRLLDILNKDTAIYDNPRKPSMTSPASNNNNNNNNDASNIERVSNGSIGDRSTTRLLPTLGIVNSGYIHDENTASGNPTDDDGSPQAITGYENVIMSHSSNPLIDDPYNNTVTLSPDATTDEPVTRFGSNTSDVITTSTSPVHVTTIDVRQRARGSSPPQVDPENQTGEAWPGDDAPTFERRDSRKSSGTDSGVTTDRDNRLEDSDENDLEVANIMSEADITEGIDTSMISNLDLMTAFEQSEHSILDHNNLAPTTGYHGNDDAGIDIPPEPEPDYRKKVRFIEAPTTTEIEREAVLDSPKHEIMATSSNIIDDPSDEMTAL